MRRAVDGDLEYVCRRDDLINVGGFKVSPFEVEAAAREVDGLSQVAVVGARDGSGLEEAVNLGIRCNDREHNFRHPDRPAIASFGRVRPDFTALRRCPP